MPWIALLIAIVWLLAGVFAWKMRSSPDWRPLLPGILATALGVGLSIAAYEWLFETQTCNGHGDLACVLNANQGLLTALTIVLAVVALWVTLLVREADRRVSRQAARQRAKVALEEAADEWSHNLIHVAIASQDDGELEYGPQLSVDHTARLFLPDIAALMGEVIMRRGDRLRRTYERLAARHDDEDAKDALGGFVNNSMHLLLRAHADHPKWCAPVLQRAGLQDIRRLAGRTAYLCFRSSEAHEIAARLRREEIPILCWVNDDGPPGIDVFPQLPRFQDMNHPPHS
jgi:hypothetical protein